MVLVMTNDTFGLPYYIAHTIPFCKIYGIDYRRPFAYEINFQLHVVYACLSDHVTNQGRTNIFSCNNCWYSS